VQDLNNPCLKYQESIQSLECKKNARNALYIDKKIQKYQNRISIVNKCKRVDAENIETLMQSQISVINKNLRKLRTVNRLTMDEVAFYTRISKSIIWNTENSKGYNPTLITLLKFCMFYNMALQELLLPL